MKRPRITVGFLLGSGMLFLNSCGLSVESDSQDVTGDLSLAAWSASTTQIDANVGFVVDQKIAVEPDGGGTAMAVWAELDPNNLDTNGNIYPIYRLYARRYNAGWGAATLIDTNTGYSAWSPRVAMDDAGNAIAVWQQFDGTRGRVYARRFAGGAWQAADVGCPGGNPDATGNDGICLVDNAANLGAFNPDIAIERDGGGTAMVAWEQYTSGTFSWSQSMGGIAESVRSLYAYNGVVYAGGGDDAISTFNAGVRFEWDGDIWAGPAWVKSKEGTDPDAGPNDYERVNAFMAYNGFLYAGMGNSAGIDGDLYICRPNAATPAPTAKTTIATACESDISSAGEYVINATEWFLARDAVAAAPDTSTYEEVLSFGVFDNRLYAGMGNGAGDGDVLVCNPGTGGDAGQCDVAADWTSSYDGTTAGYEELTAMATFTSGGVSRLYMGMGSTATTDGDIFYCTRAPGAGQCAGADWVLSFDSNNTAGRNYDRVFALAEFNGFLYAAAGRSLAGTGGDILVCNPNGSTANNICDVQAEWSVSRAGAPTYEEVRALAVFSRPVSEGGDRLYAGMGNSAGDGDVWICNPAATGGATVCESADWSLAQDLQPPAGRTDVYETVFSLLAMDTDGDGFHDRLYTGTGSTTIADPTRAVAPTVYDGDIHVYSKNHWRVQARRLTGGIAAGTWGAATVIDPSTGDAGRPRVAMDDLGNAIASFVNLPKGDCMAINDDTEYNPGEQGSNFNERFSPFTECQDDRLFVNRFLASSGLWNNPGPLDITPTFGLVPVYAGTATGTNQGWGPCFELNLGNPAANNNHDGDSVNNVKSRACVDIGEIDLSMDRPGNAIVVTKTVDWAVPEENIFLTGPRGSYVDENDTFNWQEIRLHARRYQMAADQACDTVVTGNPGAAPCWGPNDVLARYSFSVYPSAAEGAADTVANNCGVANNFVNTNDATENLATGGILATSIMNCDLASPRVAIEPDGGKTIVVVAERYSSPTNLASAAVRDLVAFRFTTGFVWQRLTATPNTWPNVVTTGTAFDDPDAMAAIDANANPAFLGQLQMDNPGNAVVVWAQSDGTKWRIYSRSYAPASGWDPATQFVDNNINAHDHYYQPVLGMAHPGGANSAWALFNGFSKTGFVNRLYAVQGP